jgi:hypothetical protein
MPLLRRRDEHRAKVDMAYFPNAGQMTQRMH